MTRTHDEREKQLKEARQKDIIAVAESLGMAIDGRGSHLYWAEHDSFRFYLKKNYFYWNSRQVGGGPIELVQLMKECSVKEAIQFLNDPTYEIGQAVVRKDETKEFNYFMKDHTKMTLTKDYLVKERKISQETVDFFIRQGLLSQATYRDPRDGKTEPVMVFKSRDRKNKITSVSLRGLWKQEKHEGNGYLRRVLGDGYTGLTLKVGNPPEGAEISKARPLRIIAFEAPIDLMSYYELYKEKLGDVILLAMDGLKKSTIAKLLANQMNVDLSEEEKPEFIDTLSKRMKRNDLIQLVLATDNDSAGKEFIHQFQNVPFSVDNPLPPLEPGQKKSDWNDVLVRKKSNQEKKQLEKENLSMEQKSVTKNHSQEGTVLENLTSSKIEEANKAIVREVEKDLEKTVSELEQPENHYLSKDDVQKMLDDHFSKIEQLLSKHINSIDEIEESTIEQAVEVTETLSQELKYQNERFTDTLRTALIMKKNDVVYNLQEHVDDLRLFIKNGINKRMLRINDLIKQFAEKVERKFAIEEKIHRVHPNEKYQQASTNKSESAITSEEQTNTTGSIYQATNLGEPVITMEGKENKATIHLTTTKKNNRPKNKFEERVAQARAKQAIIGKEQATLSKETPEVKKGSARKK